MGALQPHLALREEFFPFWGGVVGIGVEYRAKLYAGLGARPEDIFPITASCPPELAQGTCSVAVLGFYRILPSSDEVLVEF
jgi:hypothetical protein